MMAHQSQEQEKLVSPFYLSRNFFDKRNNVIDDA